MTLERHTTTLTAAEQAIARHGSVAEAARCTSVPYGDLRRAWQQINAANREAARTTPQRSLRIPDDIWRQVTARAGPRGRSAFVIAAIRKELDSP